METYSRQKTLALFLMAAVTLPLCQAPAQLPRGVFSMGQSGGGPSDNILQNPDVTGVTIRWSWADLEPTQGTFVFTALDTVLANVRDNSVNSKKVLLRISTQAGKPQWVTDAVEQAGGLFFNFDDNGVPTSIPVFWDQTYLDLKKDLITNVGAYITANYADLVSIVSVSFANATSEDWNVPHTSGDVMNWQKLAYSTDKLVDAGKQIIDATVAAFPTQFLSLAINGDGPTLDDGSCDELTNTCAAAKAIDYAQTTYPGRLIVQIDSLSTCNPVAPGPDDSAWNLLWTCKPNVAAQMVDNVYGENTYRANCKSPGVDVSILTACINQGASYGVNYIEIYETDVRHLPQVITFARNVLVPSGTSRHLPFPSRGP